MGINFDKTTESLKIHKKVFIKRNVSKSYSWGTVNECIDIIERGFKYCDPEIKVFNKTKEIIKIAEWMNNTEGKGLALIGSSGRGKTLFVHGVLPHLLSQKNNFPTTVKAVNLPIEPFNLNTNLLIDEVGREDEVFSKSSGKVNRFQILVDMHADSNNPMFFTSNINKKQFQNKYGIWIYNRILKICKVIIFEGESFWK
jgi:DNA replication protein DnaC